MGTYLEDTETDDPGYKSGQRGFTGTADPYKKEMTLRLSEDTIDTKDMLEDFIKQNQRNIELFFVEYLR